MRRMLLSTHAGPKHSPSFKGLTEIGSGPFTWPLSRVYDSDDLRKRRRCRDALYYWTARLLSLEESPATKGNGRCCSSVECCPVIGGQCDGVLLIPSMASQPDLHPAWPSQVPIRLAARSHPIRRPRLLAYAADSLVAFGQSGLPYSSRQGGCSVSAQRSSPEINGTKFH